MDSFQNKICVVTGAASGIGRATAQLLGTHGAIVIATDVNSAGLKETASLIKEAGGQCETHLVDVADRDAVFALAEKVEKKHGAADLVLNNAGVAQIASVPDLTMDDFQFVMDIDFWGVVHGTQAFLPAMIEHNSGHIANVSSIFGLIGVPRQAAYNSAKFAVLGFTEALRQDLRESDVNVSCIHPGGIDTNIVRNARFLQGPDLETRKREAADSFSAMVQTTPARAAEVILEGVRKKKARILIGRDARFVDRIRRLFPGSYERFLPFEGGLEDVENFKK